MLGDFLRLGHLDFDCLRWRLAEFPFLVPLAPDPLVIERENYLAYLAHAEPAVVPSPTP